jgi:hypothetical protein
MHIRPITLALALALGGTVACSDDDVIGPGGDPVQFSMAAVNGNGVTGTVMIQDEEGDGATVTVTLQGLEPNSQHAGHVHVGSCAAQGAILAGLNPITADAQGAGSATTTDVPDELLVFGYYVQYHVALTPPGDPISCGNIPDAPPIGDGY